MNLLTPGAIESAKQLLKLREEHPTALFHTVEDYATMIDNNAVNPWYQIAKKLKDRLEMTNHHLLRSVGVTSAHEENIKVIVEAEKLIESVK